MIGNRDPKRLSDVLIDGGVAVVPTDTVYGLIGKAFDKQVFERLNSIKCDRTLPYSVMFPSLEKFIVWYGELNPEIKKIVKATTSLPVTFIVLFKGTVPRGFGYSKMGVGFRIYNDDFIRESYIILNSPLWASSANKSGDSAPNDFSDISPNLLECIDLAIDNGQTRYKQASTVVDLRSRPIKILRHGAKVLEITRILENL